MKLDIKLERKVLGLEELNLNKRNERLIKFLDTNLFYLMLIRLKHNWICVSYIPGKCLIALNFK